MSFRDISQGDNCKLINIIFHMYYKIHASCWWVSVCVCVCHDHTVIHMFFFRDHTSFLISHLLLLLQLQCTWPGQKYITAGVAVLSQTKKSKKTKKKPWRLHAAAHSLTVLAQIIGRVSCSYVTNCFIWVIVNIFKTEQCRFCRSLLSLIRTTVISCSLNW